VQVREGELVRYMSRIVLVIDDSDPVWVEGLEIGENEIGRYKRRVLRKLDDSHEEEKETASS